MVDTVQMSRQDLDERIRLVSQKLRSETIAAASAMRSIEPLVIMNFESDKVYCQQIVARLVERVGVLRRLTVRLEVVDSEFIRTLSSLDEFGYDEFSDRIKAESNPQGARYDRVRDFTYNVARNSKIMEDWKNRLGGAKSVSALAETRDSLVAECEGFAKRLQDWSEEEVEINTKPTSNASDFRGLDRHESAPSSAHEEALLTRRRKMFSAGEVVIITLISSIVVILLAIAILLPRHMAPAAGYNNHQNTSRMSR